MDIKNDAKNNTKSGFKDAKTDTKSGIKDVKIVCNKWKKNDANFNLQFVSFFASEKLKNTKKIIEFGHKKGCNPFFGSSGGFPKHQTYVIS